MAKLVPENHPALHQIAEAVPENEITSPKIKKVLKDMRAALHSYNVEGFAGVAIAAPQIGIPLRIFLVEDMNKDRKETQVIPSMVAINPEIIKVSRRKKVMGEGCLSVPNGYGAVARALRARIRAYGEDGKLYEYGASGIIAQIFQHEIDHLDGILFIDRAEKMWDSIDDIEKDPHTHTP